MPFAHAMKTAAVLVLGTALAASPSLANNGKGNGGGNGNGNGGGNGNGKGNVEHSEGITATASPGGIKANALGKLNGFMHASATALTHASPNSEIGKIAIVYAGLLENYLSPPLGVTPPTLQQLRAALVAAANKPLSADIIAAIDAKLASVNPTLAALISAYGADSLAAAINGPI